MSLKTRLNKLEKDTANNRLWAFIGIGKPLNQQHQRVLEIQARNASIVLVEIGMLIWLFFLLMLLV